MLLPASSNQLLADVDVLIKLYCRWGDYNWMGKLLMAFFLIVSHFVVV